MVDNQQPKQMRTTFSSLSVLQICDNKGVILGYRFKFKISPHLLATLVTSSQTLD